MNKENVTFRWTGSKWRQTFSEHVQDRGDGTWVEQPTPGEKEKEGGGGRGLKGE